MDKRLRVIKFSDEFESPRISIALKELDVMKSAPNS